MKRALAPLLVASGLLVAIAMALFGKPTTEKRTLDIYWIDVDGLAQSNHPLVIQSLKPTVSIMNNGPRKGCAPEVFGNLKDQPSIEAMSQVHKNQRKDGAVNNTVEELIANTANGKSGNIIKLSVAPGGESYTIRIPATGHERTFHSN